MAPKCPRWTLRPIRCLVLVGILSAVSAMALPAADTQPTYPNSTRDAFTLRAPPPATNAKDDAGIRITPNGKKELKTFFQDLGAFIAQYDVADFLKYVFGSKSDGAPGEEGEGSGGVVTVTITADPPEITATVVETWRTTLTKTRTRSHGAKTTSKTLEFGVPTTRAVETSAPMETDEPAFSILAVFSAGAPDSDDVTWPSITSMAAPEPTKVDLEFPAISDTPSGSPFVVTTLLWPSIEAVFNATTEPATTEPTTTTWILSTTTTYVTVTVLPLPVGTATGPAATAAVSAIELGPPWSNTTHALPEGRAPGEAADLSSKPILSPSELAPSLLSLRRICTDAKVETITLPILDRFYGPNTYPILGRYPGCAPAHHARQTPGTLNCTALGAEVQRCQAAGRRVLLSVKLDTPTAVGGDLDFGTSASNVTAAAVPYGGAPNLFDPLHRATTLASTLFSLFGEARPWGMDAVALDGAAALSKPLGDNVVMDGFDVRVPKQWEGTFQGGEAEALVARLRELVQTSWVASGGVKGGLKDEGAHGKAVVVWGWS